MLKKENNQLVSNTIMSESLNTRCVTRQQSAQNKPSVPLNIPLGSTHVTTKVSNTTILIRAKKN